MDFLAQAVGIIAMVINILAVQFKKPSQFFVCRMVSSFLWGVNFLLLGSPTGAIINIANIIRSIFLLNKKTSTKPFLWISCGLYAIAGALTMDFILSWMLLLDILIVLSQWVDSVGMWSNNFRNIRYCQLFAISPVWLTHNIVVFSIGGILTEVFTIVSTIIALIRYRSKKAPSSDPKHILRSIPMNILGFDIGGTKCAVTTARWDGEDIVLLNKAACPTDLSITPEAMIDKLIAMADNILTEKPDAVGISCGGPLSSEKGIILGPPNLPGWEHVEIVSQLSAHYDVPVKLQNDANACAVAEWKFGAGRGSRNMIFMTFGTGLGAGLILDGRLYCGTNDNAGEVGHIRLDRFGPVGYGKAGSFEGFCSGGGLAQLGYNLALEKAQMGVYPAYFQKGMTQKDVTAKTVAEAANAGDATALEVYRICGEYLGKGLALVIDILNPETIVLGSIFARCQDLLWPAAQQVIEKESLTASAGCCKVVPAALGEQIGDYAAVATAIL